MAFPSPESSAQTPKTQCSPGELIAYGALSMAGAALLVGAGYGLHEAQNEVGALRPLAVIGSRLLEDLGTAAGVVGLTVASRGIIESLGDQLAVYRQERQRSALQQQTQTNILLPTQIASTENLQTIAIKIPDLELVS